MYLLIFITGYALGWYAVLPRLRDRVLHLYARARGGAWFIDLQSCPGCGHQVHVLVHRPEMLQAGIEGDTGQRCTACARGGVR